MQGNEQQRDQGIERGDADVIGCTVYHDTSREQNGGRRQHGEVHGSGERGQPELPVAVPEEGQHDLGRFGSYGQQELDADGDGEIRGFGDQIPLQGNKQQGNESVERCDADGDGIGAFGHDASGEQDGGRRQHGEVHGSGERGQPELPVAVPEEGQHDLGRFGSYGQQELDADGDGEIRGFGD